MILAKRCPNGNWVVWCIIEIMQAVYVLTAVIMVAALLAVTIKGLIYVLRGVRALINPNYYKVTLLGESYTMSEIRRTKVDINYSLILRREIRFIAFENLFWGMMLVAFGIYFLLKFSSIFFS